MRSNYPKKLAWQILEVLPIDGTAIALCKKLVLLTHYTLRKHALKLTSPPKMRDNNFKNIYRHTAG
jgi:hypothetical protein